MVRHGGTEHSSDSALSFFSLNSASGPLDIGRIAGWLFDGLWNLNIFFVSSWIFLNYLNFQVHIAFISCLLLLADFSFDQR